MEFFRNAQLVRLKSHRGSYLQADDGGESVSHRVLGSNSQNTVWAVERAGLYIRLRGRSNRYLAATDSPFHPNGGIVSCKVLQGVPASANDNAFLWLPRREGSRVVLSGPHGRLLRAIFGMPPRRNAISLDMPDRGSRANWSLWEVEPADVAQVPPAPSSSVRSPSTGKPPSFRTLATAFSSTQFLEPRKIFYAIANDDGSVDDFNGSKKLLTFNERSLTELQGRLAEETARGNVIICGRNRAEQKLFRLILDLPPGNRPMEVVLLLESSRAAKALKWPEGHGPK